MSLSDLGIDPDLIAAALAAIAVFCGIIAVAWPWLARNALGLRVLQLTDERERIRLRGGADRDRDKNGALLLREPRRMFAAIVERLNLLWRSDDGATERLLLIAGYRGRAPMVAFQALQVLVPIIVFMLAVFYVFVVIRPDLPFAARAAMTVSAAIMGHFLPQLCIKNRIAKRKISIRQSWPDALDLLLICVESGMSSEAAFRKVAEEIGGQSRELAEELSLTTAELAYLPDRRAAYNNLAMRTDLDGVRSVVSGLTQSEKYGTSLGHALRVLAQENRDMRMSDAEKRAASLPPKLTVPMILFFLPVLFAVIITPAAIQIMSN
ncbi:type II secretion system F family protein [Paracoccaceae bacterium Fryx2]|nr:type II secretion system F family protein [Paracoccaceae bacterium Fryx2]